MTCWTHELNIRGLFTQICSFTWGCEMHWGSIMFYSGIQYMLVLIQLTSGFLVRWVSCNHQVLRFWPQHQAQVDDLKPCQKRYVHRARWLRSPGLWSWSWAPTTPCWANRFAAWAKWERNGGEKVWPWVSPWVWCKWLQMTGTPLWVMIPPKVNSLLCDRVKMKMG